MTLPGKTASRFLLSAARIVLTDEQYTNGYLPDFRGDKSGRVEIPQEVINTLRSILLHIIHQLNVYHFLCFCRCRAKKIWI